MEWLPGSPQLNPIEYLWNELTGRILDMIHLSTLVPELTIAVEEEWLYIPQGT